jgi:membrane protein
MSLASRSRAPALVRVFGTALKAWWDDDALRLGAHLKAFVIDRLRSFGLVVAIGFLLMVSLAVTAALAAFSAWLSRHSSGVPLVWSGVQVLASLVGTTTLFALLYRVLPDVHLGWRDVATAAFVTAVLFRLIR